jgi:beta-1,4-mannosyltransferase
MRSRPASSVPPDTGGERPIVVLHSFRTPSSSSNPYLSQLLAALPAAIRTHTFTWSAALTGRYDVFHVQWPELLVRGRNRPRTAARRLLFALLLVVLRVRRVGVVRTVHNLDPHDAGGTVEHFLLDRLARRTTVWVTLNDDTAVPEPDRRRVIAHGHYRDWFADHAGPPTVPGRLLYFGLVRRYKGVEALIEAFGGLDDPALTLRIVGKPDPAALGVQIAESTRSDHRVSTSLAYVPDDQLAQEIGAAELVVLPYTAIHNSGSVLLALSLDRPALVPEAPTTVALQREVGGDWVHLFRSPLSPTDVTTALDRVRSRSTTTRPDLSAREWPAIGEQFAAVYREAAALAGRRYSL